MGVGRRGTNLLCHAVRRSSLFSSPITIGSQSLAGVPFIAKSGRLSTGFIGRTATLNFLGLGNRHSINNVHTDVCGTFPCRNIGRLARFVGTFRTGRKGFGWYSELGLAAQLPRGIWVC